MKKTSQVILTEILLLLCVVACHNSSTTGNTLRPAPDFSLTDLSGHPLHLSDYRGKVVILDFWATWCEPCKEEIPHLIDLRNRYSAQGVEVLGISMDDDDKPVRAFQQKYQMNYPVAVGTSSLADQYGGVLGLPITFVIDRQGRIAAKHIGATKAEVFETEVKKLL